MIKLVTVDVSNEHISALPFTVPDDYGQKKTFPFGWDDCTEDKDEDEKDSDVEPEKPEQQIDYLKITREIVG